MKFLIPVILSLFLASASGAAAQGTKVAIINSNQFTAEKGGITKLVNAYAALVIEFKPATDELAQLSTKHETLMNEIRPIIDKMGTTAATPEMQNQYQRKTDEIQNLELTIKRKQEDAKAKYEKRAKIVTDPIVQEITDAIEVYSKAHGIDLLLDGAKLDALMSFNPALNITDAFIKEFNARSAGAPVK